MGLVQDENACPSRLHCVLSTPTASVASNIISTYLILVVLPSASSLLFLLSDTCVISTSGAVVSCTVIRNDSSSALLPAKSSALHVTTVSPIGNVSPEL